MKVLITLLKPLSFLPAIIMMYLIFSFSAQTGEVSGELSYQISYKIVETENQLLSQGKAMMNFFMKQIRFTIMYEKLHI